MHNPHFEDVVEAARTEKWEQVNKDLPLFGEDEEALAWAAQHVRIENEPDPQLRDLAAGIFEISTSTPTPEVLDTLLSLMENDVNVYAQYRAAFALFVHGNRSPQVVSKLKEALQDDDVKDIARGYLDTAGIN